MYFIQRLIPAARCNNGRLLLRSPVRVNAPLRCSLAAGYQQHKRKEDEALCSRVRTKKRVGQEWPTLCRSSKKELSLCLDDELQGSLNSLVALDGSLILTELLDILRHGDVLLLNLDADSLESFLEMSGSN